MSPSTATPTAAFDRAINMNLAAPLSAPVPRCTQCAHYFITHQFVFRYGCRALGFKSRGQPSREVAAASGEPCRYFEAKPAASSAR